MNIKFTILTVVKNDKKKIEKTIKSVQEQSFKNFEYIVIDGNSDDGTFYKIKKLHSAKKFKLIRRKDKSYYDSLNFGIKLSKGEFIGILNSGDKFINKNILKKIDGNLDKKTEIFYNSLVFKKRKKILRTWKHKVQKFNKLNLFKIPHSTLFLKKNIFKKVGYYNLKYKISSDLDFIIRLSDHYNYVKYLNFNSIYMEYGGLSTSLKNLKIKLKEDFVILINHFNLLFIVFYFLKIYFKFSDFKFKNFLKFK